MPKWNEYTIKETLADNDEVMLYDATARANKRGLMSKFWDYVVNKMSTAVISKLETSNKTIIGAINALNSDSPKGILNHIASKTNVGVISVDVSKIDTEGNSIPFMLCFCDWTTGRTEISIGCYRGNEKKQQPKVIVGETTINSVTCDGTTLEVQFKQFSYIALYY